MEIRILSRDELNNAIPLVWKVFCEYEAVNYPKGGKQAFWDAIHTNEYLDVLTAYGAFEEENIVGIIATRNEGCHVALFFVEGSYHHQGIGRKLWNVMLADSTAKEITVHSSLYAVEVYKKLGFVQTDDIQDDDGIQYIPMVFRI